MLNAKILAETEMNQHSGKILATIAFQIPIHLQTQDIQGYLAGLTSMSEGVGDWDDGGDVGGGR